MGWNYSTLRSYEKGKSGPGGDFVARLRLVYPSIDIEWLLTGKAERPKDEPAGSLPLRRVALVRDIPAGGFEEGIPDELIEEWVYSTILKDPSLFALRVSGDSMSPEIKNGDIAFLTSDFEFAPGKIYAVVSADNEATLKRVYREEDGNWTLISDNPDYKSIHLRESEVIRLYRLVTVMKHYR